MKPILKYESENREKTSIHASDFGKLGIDILLSIKNTPPTNPVEWNNTLRMSAGKGVELAMIEVLKQNSVVRADFDQEKEEATQIERNGVPIRMRFDALAEASTILAKDLENNTDLEITLNQGEPIEVKSINNANKFDIQKYAENKPRESYVGQLAIYMDALQKDRGHLFVSAIDGLSYFWFVTKKIGDGIYQCGDITVDLNKEYARFAYLWGLKDKEIPIELWNEEIYKLPLDQIDWKKVTNNKIAEARNGRYVVGTESKWKIDYSSWKDLIVEKQGAKLGYTDEELSIIKAVTAGYSSKKNASTPN